VLTFFGQEGWENSSDVDFLTFCCRILWIFWKFWCLHGQGKLSQCRHFVGKRGSIFRNFVRTSLMDGPAPNYEAKETFWSKHGYQRHN